jgi:cell division GTPase FtsZ
MNTAQPLPNQNWICYCHIVNGAIDATHSATAVAIGSTQAQPLSTTQANALLELAKQQLYSDNGFILIDEEDVTDMLAAHTEIWMCMVRTKGEDRAQKAISQTLTSPSLPQDIKWNAVAASITANEDALLEEYELVADAIQKIVSPDGANVKLGLNFDNALEGDMIVTMIAIK